MAHTEDDPQMPTHPGERLRVARIGKPHGIRGEVTVQLFTDEPTDRLAPGAQLIREPGEHTQDTTRTTLTVGSQRWNKKICLLGFDEITDRNAAEALRGSVLFIDVAEEAPEDDQWYSHQLEGFSCVSGEDQPLGTVAELLPGPAQDLLVVDTAAGEQVMVPFVEELVPQIDPEARSIRLDPPAGLFP
ncbi:ribosome maturation factor RimM [Garicola koreensis]|uniref:Ribosome maturation factor RimM n=1 Tax=Garicola koreensis TaxID=1262554 RepID=A0A7W5TPC5_9MICC|nr:ribosome maturation factor RimM [Garicola koreensis]MBB3667196.1 16S rRNA processing protein RimM [Garicola koreensis]